MNSTTLLAVILSCADLLEGARPDSDEAVSALKMIRETASQSNRITHSLLTYSRQTTPEKSPADLTAFVAASVRLLRRVLPASCVIVEDYKAGELCVNVDGAQIKQVLLNLALNARDAMPGGGQLYISLRRRFPDRSLVDSSDVDPRRETAVLIIEDTGLGMSREVRSRVFEPFFTTKPRGLGTGLGLSIIHGIVTGHDGHIALNSEPGGGTRVTITLPCCGPPASAVVQNCQDGAAVETGRVIVLAESDGYVRSLIASSLRPRGYHVVPTSTGAEALQALHSHRRTVGLVVLEADLPDGSGLSCLHAIRKAHGDLPAILIAGNGSGDFPGDDLSNTFMLRKPFLMSDFKDLVGRALAGPVLTQKGSH